MKIISRQEFLKLPPNTVFSSYSPCVFGDIGIKGETIADIDFYAVYIKDAVDAESSEDYFDVLEDAEKNGASFDMDFETETRDGMFDDALFVVWEKKDILKLANRLQVVLGHTKG